jgi:SAM-dependent methyltransferase
MSSPDHPQPSASSAAAAPDLPQVRDQYEALPYPPRDPAEEIERLVKTWLDDPPMINHYCFAGRETFRNKFRALVAGGGTGDASIFLAERLKNTDAEIVHLDFSKAAIQIARERAKVRGLENITWIHDSLLNLPARKLEKFDYINCCGVLHHLADPDAGLGVLLVALKDTGALGIMLYGKIGRAGVYQMQALMRLINRDESDIRKKISNTSEVLNALPATNWFKRAEDLHHDHKLGDAGIYDLLLHSQDRAYTVGEIFEWIRHGHGLNIEFTDARRGRAPYLPHMVLGPGRPEILNEIEKLPLEQQYEIAEILSGKLIAHSFYVTRSTSCKAPYGDADYVPFFFHDPVTGPQMAQVFDTGKGKPFILDHAQSGTSVLVHPSQYGQKILRQIDGNRTFQQIFDLVRDDAQLRSSPPANETLFADFQETFDILNSVDRLLLRHHTAAMPF